MNNNFDSFDLSDIDNLHAVAAEVLNDHKQQTRKGNATVQSSSGKKHYGAWLVAALAGFALVGGTFLFSLISVLFGG